MVYLFGLGCCSVLKVALYIHRSWISYRRSNIITVNFYRNALNLKLAARLNYILWEIPICVSAGCIFNISIAFSTKCFVVWILIYILNVAGGINHPKMYAPSNVGVYTSLESILNCLGELTNTILYTLYILLYVHVFVTPSRRRLIEFFEIAVYKQIPFYMYMTINQITFTKHTRKWLEYFPFVHSRTKSNHSN